MAISASTGGIPGFYALREVLDDPEHPDHEGRLDWNGGPFDPDDMDTEAIRRDLARIAKRRKAKAGKL